MTRILRSWAQSDCRVTSAHDAMDDQPRTPEPITDSPWFWGAVFLCGALFALVLAGPKFSWRQPQIERQYQAREISGQTVTPAAGRQPLSTTGHPMLTLRPLTRALAAALAVSMILFWVNRRLRRSRSRR